MIGLKKIIDHSRPRFWHYLYGPMLVLGAYFLKIWVDLDTWGLYIYFLLFSTFVGNLFVYGINDVYDQDTDQYNPKKQWYETKATHNWVLVRYIYIIQLFYILFGIRWMYQNTDTSCLAFSGTTVVQWSIDPVSITPNNICPIRQIYSTIILSLWLFYILWRIYSAPPIRAKARPFLDGLTNCLYVVIPFCIYVWYISKTQWSVFDLGHFPVSAFVCAQIRCIAMHCFSAIPDIQADSTARIMTTAVYLGKTWSLVYCIVLFGIAGIVAYHVIGIVAILITIIYCIMVSLAFFHNIFVVYKWFPWINGAIGMLLCFYIYFIL